MSTVNGTARITAALVAVGVTLSMVWTMAALAYPAKAPTDIHPASSSATLCVCRGS